MGPEGVETELIFSLSRLGPTLRPRLALWVLVILENHRLTGRGRAHMPRSQCRLYFC
jgi:hypothetical protein